MSRLYMEIESANPEMNRKEILTSMRAVPDKGLTKQSFKNECDINKILKKAQVAGSLDHLTKHGGSYGDFADFDFRESQTMLAEGAQIFSELPSEVRNEFGNSVSAFFEFVNKPENVDKLNLLLPAIAEPGSFFPDMSSSTPPDATLEPKKEEPVVEPEVEKAGGQD